jgi:hypothetical protein
MRDPVSEEAIALMGQTFGLGRTTAINRLSQVFGLSKQVRERMAARSSQSWQPQPHPDKVTKTRIGMRTGAVAELALGAFAQGRLDRVEVRRYLNLPLTEPLPEHPGLTDEQRKPLRHPHDRVRSVAQKYLQDVADVSVECFAATISPNEGGWLVEVVKRVGDDLVPCGRLQVSYELQVRDPQIVA